MTKFLDILLPIPSRGQMCGILTYALSVGEQLPPIGCYVEVPFGSQAVAGIVWSVRDSAPRDIPIHKIREVKTLYTSLPPMPASQRRFLEWMAAYTCTDLGLVLKLMLSVPMALPIPKRASKAIIDGSIRLENISASNLALTPDQTNAVEVLQAKIQADSFSVTLLDGVTGSGKTEVYFEAIAAALKQGKQALILLPEIALSTSFTGRFQSRFGIAPALWHSGVSLAAKKQTWRRVATGECSVVAGARSALFLPFQRLGLTVVDEEHDSTYKQEEQVLYHARDMAIARANIEGNSVILASATPSLETMANVNNVRYGLVSLPARIGSAGMPDVSLIDSKANKPIAVPPLTEHWITPPLMDAVQETLADGGQALLFLNRRGFSPLTICRACGFRIECPRCTAWLVQHKAPQKNESQKKANSFVNKAANQDLLAWREQSVTATITKKSVNPIEDIQFILRCHQCGYAAAMPSECPSCHAQNSLMGCGSGVEKIAEECRMRFPEARIEVLSSDTMTSVDKWQELLAKMESGAVNLLIGTQIVAKGHHFPNLTLVGVVDGDLARSVTDFRASEKTFQVLHQVAGRAGRAGRLGRVMIQSYNSEDPVLNALARGDRDGFYALEMEARQQAGLPPFGRLAAVILSDTDAERAQQTANKITGLFPRNHEMVTGGNVHMWGPVQAPIYQLRGRFRYRFLVKSAGRIALQPLLTEWLAVVQSSGILPSSSRLSTDIDPIGFS